MIWPLDHKKFVNVNTAVQRSVKKVIEKGVEKISVNEKIIYDLVKKDPHISKNEIMVQGKLTKNS